MNILHVLSQVFASGPEFYVKELSTIHSSERCRIFVISDTLTAEIKEAEYYPLNIHDRRLVNRFRNIYHIRDFIKRNKIDVVHAHSRAASWVSYYAVKGTEVPLVSTVHGRQHLHTFNNLPDVYGSKVIAVCENLRHHLLKEMKMKPDRISVIRNPIDFSSLKKLAEEKNNTDNNKSDFSITIAGRTNGDKGERTAEMLNYVFPKLFEKYENLRLNISGGEIESLPSEGFKSYLKLKERFGDRINAIGFDKELKNRIMHSSLVICSGRIAAEALFLGKPVVAFGEKINHGIVTEENFNDVISSNFGDISEENIAFEKRTLELLGDEIERLINNKTDNFISSSFKTGVEKLYDCKYASDRIMNIYKSEVMKRKYPRHIPVLMYHKIPDRELDSSHRIFIVKDVFEKQLKMLSDKGYKAITFRDYDEVSQNPSGIKLPEKPVIITFDDGYEDNFTNALPLMKKYGFKGVLVLLGDFNIRKNYWDTREGEHEDTIMTKEQKKEFVNEGWEIAAHTMTHTDLTKISLQEAEKEIVDSRLMLEKELGTSVISFVYPFGNLNEEVKELVERSGYKFGIATDTGGLHIEDDRYHIFRVSIFPQDAGFSFIKKNSPHYRKYYRLKRKK